MQRQSRGVVSALLLLLLSAAVPLSAGGCSLLSSYLLPAGREAAPSGPPGTPAPREPLGRLIDPGRIVMAGSAVAVDVPLTWMVEALSPDHDLLTAGPGAAWEAVRAWTVERSAACSAYVAVAPEGLILVEDFSLLSHSQQLAGAIWEERADGVYLVLPEPGLVRAESGSTYLLVRPAGSHPQLPGGAVYALDCWWTPDAEPWADPMSIELLPLPGSRPSAGPAGGAAEFVAAVCTAMDELLLAVGNPDTGEGSALSHSFEAAIEARDTSSTEAIAAAMLDHLDASWRAAEHAAEFGPASVAMGDFQEFLTLLMDGVRAQRDATPAGPEAAQEAGEQATEGAYEAWISWAQGLGPVWSRVAGDRPLPCPSPAASAGS